MQHASDSKHCRRCGHAYVYEAAYLAHLGRYACPNCGARRPDPAVSASAVELRGIRSAAFTLSTPEGERRIELPLPGLYNVYNALGAAALCLRLGVPLGQIAAGLAASSPPSAAPRRSTSAAAATSILLVKNPAGANEVLRTLALEAPSSTSSGCSTTAPPTGATCRGCGTPTGRSRAARAAADVLRARAPPSWRCGSSTRASPPTRLEVVDDLERGLDRALADGDGPLYALPTYTALLELRDLLARRGHARGVLAVSATSSGTTSSAAPTAPTCRCGRSWQPAAGRCSTSGRARPRGAAPRRAGCTVDGARPRCPAARGARASAPAPRASTSDDRRRRRGLRRRRAFGLVAVPMQTIQLLPARARAGFFAARAARACARRPAWRWRIADRAGDVRRRRGAAARHRTRGRHALRVAADGGARDRRRRRGSNAYAR